MLDNLARMLGKRDIRNVGAEHALGERRTYVDVTAYLWNKAKNRIETKHRHELKNGHT